MAYVRTIYLCPPTCDKLHSAKEVADMFHIDRVHFWDLIDAGLRAKSLYVNKQPIPCSIVQDFAYSLEIPIEINWRGLTWNQRIQERAKAKKAHRKSMIDKPEPYTPMRRGWIYLFRSNDVHKIGVSTDVKQRLASFNVGPWHVEFVHAFMADHMMRGERYLHQKYAAYQVPGKREWFNLPPEVVAEICSLKDGDLDELPDRTAEVSEELSSVS